MTTQVLVYAYKGYLHRVPDFQPELSERNWEIFRLMQLPKKSVQKIAEKYDITPTNVLKIERDAKRIMEARQELAARGPITKGSKLKSVPMSPRLFRAVDGFLGEFTIGQVHRLYSPLEVKDMYGFGKKAFQELVDIVQTHCGPWTENNQAALREEMRQHDIMPTMTALAQVFDLMQEQDPQLVMAARIELSNLIGKLTDKKHKDRFE